jgi:hypothetical protein
MKNLNILKNSGNEKQGQIIEICEIHKFDASGVYMLIFSVDTDQACQFGMFVNNVLDSTAVVGKNSGAGQMVLRHTVELRDGDIVSIRNHMSAMGPVTIPLNQGGLVTGLNTECVLLSVLAISLATHYSGVSPDSKLSSKL